MELQGCLLPGCLARASVRESGSALVRASCGETRMRGCGAVCGALQEFSAVLPGHHRRQRSLRIARNHAGPVPIRCPAASQSKSGMCADYLSPLSPALRCPPRPPLSPVLLQGLRSK